MNLDVSAREPQLFALGLPLQGTLHLTPDSGRGCGKLKVTQTGPYRPQSLVPAEVPGAWVGHALRQRAFQARIWALPEGRKVRSG